MDRAGARSQSTRSCRSCTSSGFATSKHAALDPIEVLQSHLKEVRDVAWCDPILVVAAEYDSRESEPRTADRLYRGMRSSALLPLTRSQALALSMLPVSLFAKSDSAAE